MQADSASPRSATTVRSVQRAFAVVRAFGPHAPTMTLSEVAAATDLDRATARRLLLTLVDLGYVEVVGRREFRLTPRILELGYAYLSSVGLVDVARPHLQRLASTLGETASLTVLDDGDVVYVALVPGPHATAVRVSIGTRFAAHLTSMGRVLLAALPADELEARVGDVGDAAALDDVLAAVRRDGWAMADGEVDRQLRGIAVPVLDRAGRTVAAVNVSVHADRATDLERTYLPALRESARDIGAELA